MNENVAQEPAWYIFHPAGFLIVKNPPLYSSNRIVPADWLEMSADTFVARDAFAGLAIVTFDAFVTVALDDVFSVVPVVLAFDVMLVVLDAVTFPFAVLFTVMFPVAFCWMTWAPGHGLKSQFGSTRPTAEPSGHIFASCVHA
jgi:hypothetical protein